MRQIVSIFFLYILFSYFAFSAEDGIPQPTSPKISISHGPHVLEYSKEFQEKFRVLPYQGEGELLIPTGLTSLKANPKYKTLHELPNGSLLKIVAYQDEKGKMALFCGSKKESKKLAKNTLAEGERKVAITVVDQKTKQETIKVKSKTLHHTSFNNWGAVNTAGVLYKTDGVVYFHVESGQYGLNFTDKISKKLIPGHLLFMQKLLKKLYGVESNIIKKNILVKERNPGSLFPFENKEKTKEKLLKKTKLLLEIRILPS